MLTVKKSLLFSLNMLRAHIFHAGKTGNTGRENHRSIKIIKHFSGKSSATCDVSAATFRVYEKFFLIFVALSVLIRGKQKN